MLDNKIFKLLFDTRSTINRREYWASLILLLIITAISQIGTVSAFFNNSMSTKFMTDDFHFSILVSGLLGMLQPEFIPYVFILFFSSFVVAIKRCRSLGLPNYMGWLLGLFTYLFFLTLRAIPYVGLFLSNVSYDINELLSHNTVFLLAFVFILFIPLGILIMVLLSRKATTDSGTTISVQYDSFRYVFDIWKLILVFSLLALISAIWILYFSEDQFSATENLVYAFAAISLIYFCFYIRISLKRAIDAGVDILLFFGIIFVYTSITALIIYLLYLPDSSYQSIILSAFIPQIYYFLVMLITAMGFVLIALPSQERAVILDIYSADDEKP